MTAARAALLSILAAVVGPSAHAETFRSEKNYLQVELPEGVEPTSVPVEAGAGTTLVATFLGPVLRGSITRVSAPNRRAWRKDPKFFREVEEGLAKSTKGYRRLSRKQHKLGKVPALDLVFRRNGPKGREVVAGRFLFFRTFSVTLMVAAPNEAWRGNKKRLVGMARSFKPYFKD